MAHCKDKDTHTMTMIATVLGVIIVAGLTRTCECGPSSGWHACRDKCYHFDKVTMPFDSLTGHCRNLSGSAPVDLRSMTSQGIAILFNLCHVSKLEHTPYWINKEYPSIPMCRTIMFDGGNVAINQNEQCSSFMNPICEKEKSFCKTSNSSHTLNHDWLRVGGQGLYYKLSRIEYTYCYAKYLCENKRRGQLFAGGNYTYMGLLGKELGITGIMKVEFWLDSPGVSCPSGKEEGSVMQYRGPYVHIATNKSAQFQFMMVCMSDKPGTTTQTQSSTQQTYTSPRSTTQQTYMSSSSTTQQTYMLSSSTTKPTYTSSSSTSKPTYTSSSSTSKPTYTSSSSATKQTYTSSSSATKPTYTSSSSTTKQTYTSSSSTTKPTYTSSSSTTKPLIHFKAKVNTLALSKTSGEPAWLKVGKKKYFINYNCSVYKQTSSSVSYFRIFSNPVSKANSFWIGAHIITDEDLSETDVDLVPYKNEPVQFKLTKEHVQSMWKHLRQQRKSSPVNDGNAGG